MKILLVDNHTKNLVELTNLFKTYELTICKKTEFTPNLAEEYDAIVFSGGSGVGTIKRHKDIYQGEIEFIRQTNKLVIGICLGCEIIGTAFGCSLKELTVKRAGITEIDFLSKRLRVYESHKFIIDTVSPEVEILGTSHDGIEIIKHRTKPIYGMQFHPEKMVSKTDGVEIFHEILNDKVSELK